MKVPNKAVKAAGLAATAMVALSVGTAASAQADSTANLVGPGCAAYAQKVPTGPGSVAGMVTPVRREARAAAPARNSSMGRPENAASSSRMATTMSSHVPT